MAKDTKMDNKTSFITISAKNLLKSVDITKDIEVGEDDGGNNIIIKKITFL